MASFNQSFLIDRLNQVLPHPRKRVPDGIQVCCPMCLEMGQPRPDTKFRCGYRPFATGGFNLNCFNCGFKIIWRPGSLLSAKVKKLLTALHVSDQDISKLNFTAWQIKNSLGPSEIEAKPQFIPNFSECELPPGSMSLDFWLSEGLDDPDFLDVLAYAATRGDAVLQSANLHWSPDKIHGMNRRLLVPFIWQDKIVGYSGRAIDGNARPKYYTNTPEHFIINNQVLQLDRKYVIVVEGTLDAFSIDGVSTQGAKVSDEQAQWISDSGKEVIVLPDLEPNGQPLIDLALKQGWKVSIPNWDSDIKDANDAVKKYGKLYALRSVLDAATDQKLKINLLRKRLNK